MSTFIVIKQITDDLWSEYMYTHSEPASVNITINAALYISWSPDSQGSLQMCWSFSNRYSWAIDGLNLKKSLFKSLSETNATWLLTS